MVEIKNVAIAGSGGALAPRILESLVAAGTFNLTILKRASSSASHASARMVTVDFESTESLVEGLKGQDAVICAFGMEGLHLQIRLIDAAIAAKVKLFIPGEFGSNSENPKARELPVFKIKVNTQDYLKKKAAEGIIAYTLVFNGPLLDRCIGAKLLIDVPGHKATLYDGGDQLFSTTTAASVGRAFPKILSDFEMSRNRAYCIQDTAVSQKTLVRLAEKVTGQKFETETADTAKVEADAYKALQGGTTDDWVWIEFLKRAIWGEGYGALFEKTDNDILGIKGIGESEIEAIIARYV